ncbi:MAG: hypothetical protein PHE18_03600, partial [Candidatus Omnitrophica bacterium]|nr:hypothetical protein [Candidatus Omnitrophota bacterium]
LKNNLKIDVATARKEHYPQPAHLPVVICGILDDDLTRRDFTINSMAISLNREDFGGLIDCFKSAQDLKEKKIRVLHDLSFIDDPTRILRAIRFEQRYGFRIEPKTLRLLKEADRLDMLHKVQPHRLRDELILMLNEDKPLRPLKRLKELIGFDFIHPKIRLSNKIVEDLKSIEKQISWFGGAHAARRQLEKWLMYFIGLTGQMSSGDIKSICKKFALRKGEEKRMLAHKSAKPAFIRDLSRKDIKPSRLFGMLEPLSYENIVLLKAVFKNSSLRKNVEDFLKIYNGTRVHVTGEDLARLGITPGPVYQKILRRVLEAKLDGRVKTKDDELKLVSKIAGKK